MAVLHDAPDGRSWLTRVLTTDFCPWANRFVYWLKEPIGWFVLAIATSVLVGRYANPIGWTVAGALSGIILVGMLWPLIAVWATTCELHPEVEAVHEGTSCRMLFSVQNRLPLPSWGLAVEGYLDCEGDESRPVVALSHVPPLCVADYAIDVHPTCRGHYPIQTPRIACAFPFGIWTARRSLRAVTPLTVWPRVYEIAGACPLTGTFNAEFGDGARGGRSGDYVGVRDFRRGDSPRHINWAQSARTDSLIVTERGGPQCVELDLFVDPTLERGHSRHSLAVRLRVAASIFCHLHTSRVPARVVIGDTSIRYAMGGAGRRRLLDALADVPADGLATGPVPSSNYRTCRIEIRGAAWEDDADVLVSIIDPNAARRAGSRTRSVSIKSSQSLDEQLGRFWQELGYVPVAA